MVSFLDEVMLKIAEHLFIIQRFVFRLFLMLRFIGQKKIVPPTNDPLLLMSATKLAEQIREGKVQCESVILSYIKRIRQVQPYINAVVEDRFGEAIAEAKVVDSLIALNYKSKDAIAKEKPLLGVPVTVKLMIQVKGMHANGASKYFEYRKATQDHDTVLTLKNAGAIIIATTNMPEFASQIYTSNNLYGRTNNPYDTTRSAGGSSGGEAALVAAAGSVLGLGNDMGGSLRIPASFCGIFTHKSSVGITSKMQSLFPEPCPLVREYGCTGPMCRYAEDLLTSMRVLAGPKRADLKLDEPVDITNLKVYYMQSDGESNLSAEAHGDILFYQFKAKTHFEEHLGARTKNLELQEMRNIFFHTIGRYTLSRNEKSLQKALLGRKNAINACSEIFKCMYGASRLEFYNLLSLILDKTILNKCLRETPEIVKRFYALEEKFSSLIDDRTILLIPAFPYKATYHGEAAFLLPCIGYCSAFNVLGMPSTLCPLSQDENGLPIGIQIVASKNNDRLTIACAVELERIFGGWKQPRGNVIHQNDFS